MAAVKGEDTLLHLPVVSREYFIELPPALSIVKADLAPNVMYVKDKAFIPYVDRKVKCNKYLVSLGKWKLLTC